MQYHEQTIPSHLDKGHYCSFLLCNLSLDPKSRFTNLEKGRDDDGLLLSSVLPVTGGTANEMVTQAELWSNLQIPGGGAAANPFADPRVWQPEAWRVSEHSWAGPLHRWYSWRYTLTFSGGKH